MDKNNIGLVEWCKFALEKKYGYVYGMFFDAPVTRKSLDAKARQYGEKFTADYYKRSEKWIGQYAGDCIGLCKAYIWEKNGKVRYNAKTDTSANGTFERAKIKGTVDTIPETAGLLVWKTGDRGGHIGVYIGNGDIIEARGVDYGVVQTKLKDRNFTHWLEYPFITYVKSAPRTLKVTSPQMYGNDVRQVQQIVGAEVDGYYGPKTEALVKYWQEYNGLVADGIVGAKSWEAIKNPCYKELQDLKEQVEALRKYSTDLEGSIKAISAENDKIKADHEKINRQLSSATSELKTKTEEVKSLSEKNTALLDENKRLSNDLQEIRKLYDSEKDERELLEEEINKLSSERNNIVKSLQTIKNFIPE